MPSLREYKVALKSAALAFMAGAHCSAQVVLQRNHRKKAGSQDPTLYDDLLIKLKDFLGSAESGEILSQFLSEEELYPFGENWPEQELAEIISLAKVPALNQEDPHEFKTEFRFKKGFMNALSIVAKEHYLERDEDAEVYKSTLDHWLLLVINTSFYAGASALTQVVDGAQKLFHDALAEIEEESEAWARYPQLTAMIDKEVSNDVVNIGDYEIES